jgi:hypothetical protein
MTMILSIQWRWMVLLMCVVSESGFFSFFLFFFCNRNCGGVARLLCRVESLLETLGGSHAGMSRTYIQLPLCVHGFDAIFTHRIARYDEFASTFSLWKMVSILRSSTARYTHTRVLSTAQIHALS